MRRILLAAIPIIFATPVLANPGQPVTPSALPAGVVQASVTPSDTGSGASGDEASERVSAGPAAKSPSRLTSAQKELCETIAESAQGNRLPVGFFTNLIWQESRFNPRVVSHAGAQGIAQFMPRTAEAMGLRDPFDPAQALPAAGRLLRSLVERFGNLGLAAAAYNAGPKRVLDWLANRGKLPGETHHYVVTITGHAADKWKGDAKPVPAAAFPVAKAVPCREIEWFAQAEEAELVVAQADQAERPRAAGLDQGMSLVPRKQTPALAARRKRPVGSRASKQEKRAMHAANRREKKTIVATKKSARGLAASQPAKRESRKMAESAVRSRS
jgi:hypothetical protein